MTSAAHRRQFASCDPIIAKPGQVNFEARSTSPSSSGMCYLMLMEIAAASD
ncbi:MAG: adenylate cyclase, partial [Mesorhizobium sp.]